MYRGDGPLYKGFEVLLSEEAGPWVLYSDTSSLNRETDMTGNITFFASWLVDDNKVAFTSH